MKDKMARFHLQTTAILLLSISWSIQSDYQILSDNKKALYGHSISNTTTKSIGRCLQQCLANCLCKSFQVCHNTECQLCSSNKYSHPKAMRDNKNCSTFNFQNQSDTEVSANQCGESCTSGPINCCLTSNPCLYGGTCVSIRSYGIHRYTCKCPPKYHGDRCEMLDCPPGYHGKLCDKPMKSCRDVASKDHSLTPPPGIYTILDVNLNPFQVFCDFEQAILTSWSWTLVQSYALHENQNFLWTSLRKDAPKMGNKPNWLLHRLGRPKMDSIRQQSTKWRITCCYDTVGGVDYQDYVRGLISEVDLLNFEGQRCVTVDYIDIRGQNCSNCTAYVFQKVAIFHFPSNKGKCDFQTTGFKDCSKIGLRKFESNFGFYGCTNEQHRCSSNPNATTQIWFGAQKPLPARPTQGT